MNDIERAISEISDIRLQLAASTRFRGYAPEAVATIGIVSLGVLLAQLAWPEKLAADSAQVALVWGAVLLAGAATVAVEAIARTRRQHGGMANVMLRGAMRIAVPISIVDLVLGAVILLYAPEAAWLLPAVWQMLTGVVAFSSYSIMPRAIVWPGGWYVIVGAIVCFISGMTGTVTPLLAGGPFVVGHLTIAWLLCKQGVQNG